MTARRQVCELTPDNDLHKQIACLAVNYIQAGWLADNGIIDGLAMRQQIARAMAAATIMPTLVIAHRAANRRLFALAGNTARHDMAAQLYAGSFQGDQCGKRRSHAALHVVSSQTIDAIADLVSLGPMIRARYAERRVIFPEVACIRRVEVTIEHQRRAITGAAHHRYDIGSSFFHFLKLCFNAGVRACSHK